MPHGEQRPRAHMPQPHPDRRSRGRSRRRSSGRPSIGGRSPSGDGSVLAFVRLDQELEHPFGQPFGAGIERSNGDREAASRVVRAIAERAIRECADRMLEQTGVVGHALQVSERGLRRRHAAASRSANTRCASRKYSADLRPRQSFGLELGLSAHRTRERVIGQQTTERLRDRHGILVGDDDPAGAHQLLDRMRERGGDDRLARRDGLDQDTRADLLARLVRQEHDVGAADQRAK